MTSPVTRQAPRDEHAERAILASCLLDSANCLPVAEDILVADDFYIDRHAVVWGALVAAAKANGGSVDTALLTSQLELTKQLERAGGHEFLLSLTDAIPVVDHVEAYAKRIRNLAAVRAVITAAMTVVSEGYGKLEDIDAFLDRAEGALGRACEHRTANAVVSTLDEVVVDVFEDLTRRSESGQKLEGYSSGYHLVDRMLGGFVPGDYSVVAGRPGMGKTAFAMGIATGVAKSAQLPVVVFSYEMPKKQLGQRVLASDAGVNLHNMRHLRLNPEDWRALTSAAGAVSGLPIYVVDDPSLTVLDMRHEVRRLKRRFGKLAVVVVDYLQLVRALAAETREQAVAEISRNFKLLAKQEDLHVMALSQLNRGPEKNKDKRPGLADLRESGAIEQDADNVLFIYRDEVYDPDTEDKGIAEIIFGKQRSGPTGTVRMLFKREYTRFENLESRYGDDDAPRGGHWMDDR